MLRSKSIAVAITTLTLIASACKKDAFQQSDKAVPATASQNLKIAP